MSAEDVRRLPLLWLEHEGTPTVGAGDIRKRGGSTTVMGETTETGTYMTLVWQNHISANDFVGRVNIENTCASN